MSNNEGEEMRNFLICWGEENINDNPEKALKSVPESRSKKVENKNERQHAKKELDKIRKILANDNVEGFNNNQILLINHLERLRRLFTVARSTKEDITSILHLRKKYLDKLKENQEMNNQIKPKKIVLPLSLFGLPKKNGQNEVGDIIFPKI